MCSESRDHSIPHDIDEMSNIWLCMRDNGGNKHEAKDDAAKILEAFASHQAEFARFAERQELAMSKIVERLDGLPVLTTQRGTCGDVEFVVQIPEKRPVCEQPWNFGGSGGEQSNGEPSSTLQSGTLMRSSTMDDIADHSLKSPVSMIKPKHRWKRGSSSHSVNSQDSGSAPKRCICTFLRSRQFDISMGLAVLLHMLAMCAQLQWRSRKLKAALNSPTAIHINDPRLFSITEDVFNLVYLVELVVRLSLFGLGYFRQSPVINTIDSIVIVVCCVTGFIMKPLGMDMQNGMIALARLIRMVRILRILRSFRIFRYLNMFTELRVIIQSLLSAFGRTLLWASIIIGFTVFTCSLLIATLIAPMIEDHTIPSSDRTWLYDHFGSTTTAAYTLFEATFTGRWGIVAKPLIFDYNPAFAIFFVVYVVGVNFAMIRVIGAIFLKQTMDQASLDSEKRQLQLMKETQQITDILREIYTLGDQDGDGQLSLQEFNAMLENPRICEVLEELNINEDEFSAVFSLLIDENGTADFEEFVQSVLKLRSSAQVIDIIQILHAQVTTLKKLERIKKMLKEQRRPPVPLGSSLSYPVKIEGAPLLWV